MKTLNIKNILVATLGLTFLSIIFDFFQGGVMPIANYSWNLLANLLIVIPFGYYANSNPNQSKKIWQSTFLIFYVIGYFNILIEAWIFNVTDRGDTTLMLLLGIPYSAIASFFIVYLFRGWLTEPSKIISFKARGVGRWIAKILGANFLYFIFYIAAGIFLQALTPRFSEFYGDKIPDFIDIIITNMFFRGFVFVSIVILIDRTIEMNTITKALLIGAIFAILGGIAPLLPPNPLMPPFIRFAHGFEVGISNLLYGISAFYILRSVPLQKETSIQSSEIGKGEMSEEPTVSI